MRNIIRITAIVFLCTGLLSCRNGKTGVEITMDGWGDDTVYMVSYRWGDDVEKTDTLKAERGVITLMTTENDTTEVVLCAASDCIYRPQISPAIPESYSVRTIILPGTFEKISGERTDKGVIYTSDGVELQSHMASEHIRMLPLLNTGDSLNKIIETTDIPDSSLVKAFEARNSLYVKRDNMRKEFIEAHPSAQLSGRYLCSLDYEDMATYADKLSPEVLSGLFKDRIEAKMGKAEKYIAVKRNKEAITAGNPAPDFTLTDINGRKRSLSEFKGRYAVLDFWGTWCGWCLKGIPDMKKMYDRYHDKMGIVGIACHDTPEALRKAVEEHDLKWTNLINEDDNDISVLYAVEGFPTKIVIDPEGTILSVTVGEEPGFYTAVSEILD